MSRKRPTDEDAEKGVVEDVNRVRVEGGVEEFDGGDERLEGVEKPVSRGGIDDSAGEVGFGAWARGGVRAEEALLLARGEG